MVAAGASKGEAKRFLLTWDDLSDAQVFAREYLDRKLYETPLSIDARAYATAMVVSYVRPFSRNYDDGPQVDVGFLTADFSAEQLSFHQAIYDARGRVFAHSDAKAHEIRRGGGDRHLSQRDARRPPTKETVERLLECIRIMKKKLIPYLREAESWGGDAE